MNKERNFALFPTKQRNLLAEVDHRLPGLGFCSVFGIQYSSKSEFPDNSIFLISGFCLPTTSLLEDLD